MKSVAILNIDMIKDTIQGKKHPLAEHSRAIVPRINHLLAEARKAGAQVIFPTDSFLKEDYFFKVKSKPYAIRGTDGANVIDDLKVHPDDIVLPKRRFSAFFKTDLDQTLRVKDIDTVVITGITTPVCVLATVLDALSHDFKVILIEDCCAAQTLEIHQGIIDLYKEPFLDPFLKIMTAAQFLSQNGLSPEPLGSS